MSGRRTAGIAGRPTKINDTVTAAVVEALEAGATLAHAANAAGVTYMTLHRWLLRGEQATRGRFREFCEAVQGAIAASALFHLRNIREQARDDWRASAWILEHRFPGEYGSRAHIQMEHSGAVTVQELTAARHAVLTALADYPAARLAVAAKLAAVDTAQRHTAGDADATDDGDDDDDAS